MSGCILGNLDHVQREQIEFRVADDDDDLQAAFAVRAIVFCGEQHVPYALERDGGESECIHVVGFEDREPIAAGRIRRCGEYAKLERIAVRGAYRGRRIGRSLLEFMISVAIEEGYAECRLHAQLHAVEFYAAHGFEPRGQQFMEAGIAHVLMVRDGTHPVLVR